jgi:cyclopropane fatty-acyl-phospholipid synthase-like methyltransferase
MTSTPSESNTTDPFFDFYDREDVAYGLQPSAELAAFLSQCPGTGEALDLGAGAGRDTLALAGAGFQVTSVDVSQRGLDRIAQRAARQNVSDRVTTVCSDVRDLEIAAKKYFAIVATTVLDHIPGDAAQRLWQRLVGGITDDGVLYVEVHTTDDPGCQLSTTSQTQQPVSETAEWVINYFARGALLRMAANEPRLRVLRYEERYEWDTTHGHEHLHGKAILLATTMANDPKWYGHPEAFPRP